SPEGEEKGKMLNKAFEFVWDRIKARKVVRENIADAKLLGDAIAYVYWDEKAEGRRGTTIQGDPGYQYEGEIRIKSLDIASFYPDPDAFDIEDCRFIHIVERKPLEWLKKNQKFGHKINEKMLSTNENPADRGEIYLR